MSRFFFITATSKDSEIPRIAGYLRTLPAGLAFKVEISELKNTRSNDQNAYLWGVVYPTILKRLQGWDGDDLHEYFLGEHFGWETLEGLGRKRLKPIRRSSKLSPTEFREHWQFIQRKMAEIGIDIPDPNEDVAHAA